MTKLTDQMYAALATLKTQHGMTEEQVNAAISRAVAPLQANISEILAGEKSDDDKIADVTAAVQEFADAFAPASPTPDAAPAPAAPAPAPEPAPTPAPDAPAAA